jgi:predicted ATP-binding protein involved in virulence
MEKAMYLRSIQLKNTGPIQELSLTMPFENDMPKPLVLVGRNGSGKSTVISFIVNALVGIKQQIYEDVEVEKGRVYRIRSPLGINGGERFFFARLNFDRGVSLIEWQLVSAKNKIPEPEKLQEIDASWNQIPDNETSYYSLPLGELAQPHLLEDTLQKQSLLFFPADRFEPPDWLNAENLSSELRLPEPSRMKGRTMRRIFSRNRLKPTLEWLNAVIFDMMVAEHTSIDLPNAQPGQKVQVRIAVPGKAHAVFESIRIVLQKVLCQDASDHLQLGIGDRNSRIINATVRRNGVVIRSIKDLLSLSAGESALFCLFASIIRDADLSSMTFQGLDEICGIVLVDEADLHLHLGLQYEVLPRLIALFPRIQFVITAHAPLVSLGLEKTLGTSGFEIRDMPTGALITPESYSEFEAAFDVLVATKRFQNEVLEQINAGSLPALLVEGKTDASLIATAWMKLYPDVPMPFEAIPCGIEPDPEKREGGADMLRRCTEFLSIVSDRFIITLFDHDSAGSSNFVSLSTKGGFAIGQDTLHKKHATKPMHAILLPAPTERSDFVSSPKVVHRYLSIEHYFSDAILAANGLKGDPIVPGAAVFEIDASSAKKVAFSEAAKDLDSKEFDNFKLLFDRLKALGFVQVGELDPA